jgi:hypothetical protein
MQPQQLLGGIIMGSVFIAAGLIPGLVSKVAEEIQDFGDMISPYSARDPRYRTSHDGKRVPGQIWLAVWGVGLIGASLFDYFSR